jgi:hypothetical protein
MRKVVLAAALLAGICTPAYALSSGEIGEIMYGSDVVLAADKYCHTLAATQNAYNYTKQIADVPNELRANMADHYISQIVKMIKDFGIDAFCYAAYDNYGPNGRSVAGLLTTR